MHEEDIQQIIESLRAMQGSFQVTKSGSGTELDSRNRATTKRLLMEAKTIFQEDLGPANNFSFAISNVINAPSFGFFNPPSEEQLQEGIAAIEGGLNQVRRKHSRPKTPIGTEQKPPYVAAMRILELQSVAPTLWDTKRLVRMLQELNTAHANGLLMATAMLVRAVCDHIPPIFSAKNFPEVANNYAGGKSISGNLKHLDTSLRNIADGHLHAQIRKREVLPSPAQVDFSQDLDVLLQEVMRVLRP